MIGTKPGTGPTGEEPVPPSPTVGSVRLPHLPGLDGLRGLAVIGVLLFHSGFSWARGGFLGVSTFFVLSGFLITSLLLREWDNSGTIRLGRFWARRLRRLLPAALLTLALVALLVWRLGTAEQLANLRWDLLAALAYVANWRFYFDGTSYADLFSAPGPLQHFWSLAIEEQFYLLFPPIVIALLKMGGRRLLLGFLCAAGALSIGLGLWLGGDLDRIYYGTDTRAAELLAGALLALWWSRRLNRSAAGDAGPGRGQARIEIVDLAGGVALVGMFWAWWAIAHSSPLITHAGLPLYAILTTVIIRAAIQPSLVARLLSWRPLRWVGLVSYGLYLYHWPVFLILDRTRLGWPPLPLFALQMSVTIAMALASYHILEMPIRRGRILRTNRAAGAAALAGALLVGLCAILLTMNPPRSTVPYAEVRLQDFAATVEAGPDPTPASSSGPTAGVSATGKVMIVGDSGTVDASPALRAAFEAAGATAVWEKAFPGVGLGNPQLKWRHSYRKLITRHNPDLVIMMLGAWDIQFLQERGDQAYAGLVDEAVEIFTARGAKLLWLSMLPGGATPEREVNRVYQKLADRYPGRVAYADIEAALRAPPGATSPLIRQGAENWPRSYIDADGSTVLLRKPDFWHLCPTGAERLAAAVIDAAVAAGWAAPAQAGWRNGKWRADRRYNDPEGGCELD